jgi:hypothetical protein
VAKSGRWMAKLGIWVAYSRRWLAKSGRWMAKLGRWVAKSGRWVAKSGRWVAKSGRWVVKSGRWVAKSGRWLAKLVARLLATAAIWVRIQTYLNTKSATSAKECPTHFSPPKKYSKKWLSWNVRCKNRFAVLQTFWRVRFSNMINICD